MAADLLVCDLDGTLLDSSLVLDAELVAAFRAAIARGLHISLATGRMPQAVDRCREALGIAVPAIYDNGALIRDAATGRDLLAHRLPRGVLSRALSAIGPAPVHPLFVRDERVHCLGVTPDIQHFCDVEALVPCLIREPIEFLRSDAFVKGLCIGAPDDLGRLRTSLEEVVAGDARLVRTAGRYLEIVPAAADRVAPHRDRGGLLALFAEVLPDYFGRDVIRAAIREEMPCPE